MTKPQRTFFAVRDGLTTTFEKESEVVARAYAKSAGGTVYRVMIFEGFTEERWMARYEPRKAVARA